MMVHFLAVFLVDVGLVLALLGAISLVRPLQWLRIASRRRALRVLAVGAFGVALGVSLPAPEIRVETPRSALDHALPTYQFSEYHQIHVAAPPARTLEAIRAVTAGEITLFRTLTAIRRLGRPGAESVLNAPESQPILDVVTRTSFLQLTGEPGREIVVGTLVAAPAASLPIQERTAEWYQSLSGPGYAKAVMNFVVEPDGAGTLVTTETRVFATDASTRRRFAAYWRIIYPGSAVIRRMWLRAIRRRAEGPVGGAGVAYSPRRRPSAAARATSTRRSPRATTVSGSGTTSSSRSPPLGAGRLSSRM